MTEAEWPLAGIEAEEYEALCAVDDLPEDKRRFVMEWMRSRDPMRAYRAAGWHRTGNDAKDRSFARNKTIRDPEIAEAIAALQANRLRKLKVDRATIEGELAKIAFASMSTFMRIQDDGTAYLDFSEATHEDLSALESFKCEIDYRPGDDPDSPKQVMKMQIKMTNKLGALEKLARIHKLIGGDDALDAVFDIAEAIKQGRKRAGMEG